MTYTREQILSMPAGRELDKIAAKVVMGYDNPWFPFFASTDISAAFKLVEKFDLNTFHLNWLDKDNPHGMGWHCKLRNEHVIRCNTAPEAITKAAILAIQEQSGGTGE